MKVLLSIKPEYAEKILDGKKLFEFRRSLFRDPKVQTIVIYATKPIGKIIGEFEIDGVLSDNPDEIWSVTSEFSGISENYFKEYFCGRDIAHAIKVKSTKRYKHPKELSSVIQSGVAPQSFCYLA